MTEHDAKFFVWGMIAGIPIVTALKLVFEVYRGFREGLAARRAAAKGEDDDEKAD